MAYRIEQNGDSQDIVIDGFEKGIANSPEEGFGDMRGINITSIPSEASVSYSTSAATIPPTGITSAAFTASASTDTFTVASTAGYFNGMAIKLETVPVTVNALVVAGGGGGGKGEVGMGGGGGGAGGYSANAALSIAIGSYAVTVGGGGAGSASDAANGTNGSNSSIAALLTATGGGGGSSASTTNGSNGGSGGGGISGASPGAGGTGVVGQGNAGGAGGTNGPFLGGGGGGASAVGAVGGSGTGNGGNGTANSISGSSVTYAGGGGGGSGSASGATHGSGGTGGGGNGGDPVNGNTGNTGTTNRGGGGGGGANAGSGGGGGSGIVVISYPTGLLTATGGSITTSGGNTIHTFTTGGTFAITGIAGITVGGYYYIGNLTPTTFKLYADIFLNTTAIDITSNITGTYSVPSFGVPVWGTPDTINRGEFLLDNTGAAWYLTLRTSGGVGAGVLQYLMNSGHTTSVTGADFGIVLWKNYLFVIVANTVDYLSSANLFGAAGPNGNWVYSWKTTLALVTSTQHQAISATDDAMYICNAAAVASLLQNPSTTFDPTSSGTYTFNVAALALPSFESAQCLAQLGQTLLVGGIYNYIYPWDRVSTSFTYPLICADMNIVRIVATNSSAYVFAGQQGRIYITNGAQIQIYKKVPDALSGAPEPYYTWQDAIYTRNKLCFTLTATNNTGTVISTMGGVWAIEIDPGQNMGQISATNSLSGLLQLSYGTYGGSCPVLFYDQFPSPSGFGIGGAWVNSGINGIDIPAATPYTNYQTYIDTDIVPIGTYFDPQTDQQIEYKLSKPLVTGESIRIAWRGNLTDSFTTVATLTTTGQVSDYTTVNFQNQQWLQLRVSLASTNTTPSYDRLRELRIR